MRDISMMSITNLNRCRNAREYSEPQVSFAPQKKCALRISCLRPSVMAIIVVQRSPPPLQSEHEAQSG